MTDASALTRQWKLLTSLSARRLGVTIRELADEHAVTQKTIRRDLLLLKRLGFPLEETVSDHGRKHWQIAEPNGRLPLGFNFTEALALYLGRKFLEPLAGTHFWTEANSALSKIRASLGETALKYVDRMTVAFHHSLGGAADYARKADLLDDLTVAIEDCKVTFLEYQSENSTEPVTREIHPYGWIYHRNALYLVARAAAHQAVRIYKLDRMESADITDLRFPRPADFRIADYVAGAFGIYRGDGANEVTVKIRFAASVARYVKEKSWHASQQLHPLPDGAVVAEFRLSTTEEIKHWLLSFGAQAEVLEPPALVADLRAEAAALTRLYNPPRPPSDPATRSKPKRKPR